MLAPFLAALVVSQAPTAPAPAPAKAAPSAPIQVLLLDLSAIDVSADKVKLLAGRLAASMGNKGLEVLTRADLRTMASLEADKAATGCEEGSQSCLAEIAAALGTRLVVSGQVGSLDDTIFLQLSLFDSQVGKAVAREEARGKTLSQLADAIPAVVDRMMAPVLGTPLPDESAAAAPAAAPGLSPMVVGGGAALGVGVIVGGILTFVAVGMDQTLGSASATAEEKQGAYDSGAYVVAGAGAAAVVAVAGGTVLALGLVSE